MPCTTVLVGKKATNNGSTMIARNDDNGNGHFEIKKFAVILPDEQPRHYKSVLSHVEIDLPDHPMRYTAVPNVNPEAKGIWAAAGINAANVAMTATETITTNPRVQGADPLVEYVPAQNGQPEKAGGIGEEDIVYITLPYITSARDGVKRLGMLLEEYGTYENNGIAFSDHDEVWYMETVGGHHWIARRLPDECYSVIANEFSLDIFDLEDATTTQKNYMASADIKEFIEANHLCTSRSGFNARLAFGSHSDADHVYNTPRVWFGQRYFNPSDKHMDQLNLRYGPESGALAWCRKADHLITVEDVKYVLSSTYQGTPYSTYSNSPTAKLFRPIGINRTAFCSLAEIRNGVPEEISAIEWLAFASNAYNAFVPLYTNIDKAPEYLTGTTMDVNTNNFYWNCRLISALGDAQHDTNLIYIERYQDAVEDQTRRVLVEGEREFKAGDNAIEFCNAQDQKISDIVQKLTASCLDQVLFEDTCLMRNGYNRSDN